MIVQELVEYESDAGRVLERPSGCHSCSSPCASFAPQPKPRSSQVGQPVILGLDNWGFNKVVFILFGTPLVLIVCAVALLQSYGFADQPLTSLVVIAGLLFAAVKIIAPRGAALLNLLQVQRLSAPVPISRITA